MRKIHREDWFAAGKNVLEAYGFARLTIDELCSSLNMTKGSFYHHFHNMDGYIVAFMQYWTEQHTLDFIRKAESQRLLGGKAEFLARLAAELNSGAERAIRAWSSASALVRMYLQQVDAIRLKYLEGLMLEQGLEGAAALGSARLEYALMVGMQQLYPGLSRQELLALYELRS